VLYVVGHHGQQVGAEVRLVAADAQGREGTLGQGGGGHRGRARTAETGCYAAPAAAGATGNSRVRAASTATPALSAAIAYENTATARLRPRWSASQPTARMGTMVPR